MTAALQARGISKAYGGALILDQVDLAAEAGRITVIIGPNGAGKSTLFDCLSGTVVPDGGRVLHRGDDVTGRSSDALARRGLARTFQHSSVFPTLTVAENLLVAAENHRAGGLVRGLLGLTDPGAHSARELVRSTLADLHLLALADARAGGLPSGTLRQVELARALCCRPDVLLLDEPASGLDDAETELLHLALHGLAARRIALVVVEHDLDLVHDAADVVHVMSGGRIVAAGSPAAVLARSDVRALLYGRAE